MKFGVITFPGSNSDDDALAAVTEVMGGQAVRLWHKDHDLQGADVIVLPGGFAHGDYLRPGAIARFSPIMKEVIEHANRGGPVIGICNGFQIACEAHLLPGALLRNTSLQHRSFVARVRVETTTTRFTQRYAQGQVLRIPISHGDGRYTIDADGLARLQGEGRIVFRYVDEYGNATAAANPNGALDNIAGIVNERGNVIGLMPHPERAMGPTMGSGDGVPFFESILAAVGA